MISKTVINVSTSSSVSLSYTSSKSKGAEDGGEKDNEIKDTINLGVGLDVAEKLRNAKDTDDLAALLKEGQEEAKAAIAKFQALREERYGALSPNNYAERLFDAVRRAVVDVLSEQAQEKTTTSVSIKTTQTFEMRIAVYMGESAQGSASSETAEDNADNDTSEEA